MTTKFNIGQTVWCVTPQSLFKASIDYISIAETGTNYMFNYPEDEVAEDMVFDNPSDATIAWMNINNLELDTFVIATIKPLESN